MTAPESTAVYSERWWTIVETTGREVRTRWLIDAVDEHGYRVVAIVGIPEPAASAVLRAVLARRALADARAEAAAANEAAALLLADRCGFPLSEVGAVLSVSKSQAANLVRAAHEHNRAES